MENKILVLSADEVEKSITLPEAIDAMSDAFIELSSGKAISPVRTNIPIRDFNATALFMPVYFPKEKLIGLKTVNVHNENPDKNLPLIHALYTLFDAETGATIALMDGEKLTAVRTGAASGLAANLLAKDDSSVAAIFGAGVQGRTQLEAVCAVRKIKRAIIFDLSAERAEKFVSEMSHKLDVEISIAGSIEELKQADIICTATTSAEPLFSLSDVKPGVHVNGIGSYKPNMCELPHELISGSKVVVDSREACLKEAGDIIQPIERGMFSADKIYAEIGEIAAGKSGRTSDSEITVFKSVGNAVQDVAAAAVIYKNAVANNLGNYISF